MKNNVITILILMLAVACSSSPTHQSKDSIESTSEFKFIEINTIPGPVKTVTKPSPITSAKIKYSPHQTPTQYADVWARIRDNLQLDRYQDNRAVKERIAWYARNQEYLDRVVVRATPYIYYILEEVEKRNMPVDLALLPIVESAFQPFAYSRSHASGIWQFIPSTGRVYGLKQNWWYDGRRDIVAATRAALDYLEKLHKQFSGDWQHALAAYNSGELNVERAIKRNVKSNKDTDFFSLRLFRETRGYVPSLLAVAEIIADPIKYAITLAPIANEPYFNIVDIGGQLDLSTASDLTGLSMEDLYILNPGFNRWATDPEGPHYLLVPVDKKKKFIDGLSAIPVEDRVGWNQHVIKQGESLSQIAEKYKTSVSIIKETNKLRNNLIRTGHSLVIPTSKQPGKFYTLSLENRWLGGLKREGAGNKYVYTVRRGDSLWTIGRRYDVTIRDLCGWNGINARSIIRPGQKITLWVTTPGEKSQKIASENYSRTADGHIQYTVKSGDSLWLISRQFGVTVDQLQKWNKLPKGKFLHPGQKLVLLDAPALATGA